MRAIVFCCWLSLVVGCGKEPIQEIRAAAAPATPASAVVAAPNDWPWWRGPLGDGKAVLANPRSLPVSWSESENIRWRMPVPGSGHASPVVCDQKIFLAAADESANTQSLLAFDRASGKQLWKTDLHQGALPHRHEKNSHASATPACDGELVFSVFVTADGLWVSAVDLAGNIRWRTKAGPFSVQHGYGSSPVLYQSLVIVSGDNQGPGYLAALDRQTGDVVWRVKRTDHPSYSTPIIGTVAGKPQLLTSGGYLTISYDPLTGNELWRCDGPTQVTACTMAFDDQRVYVSGGYPDKEIICIRADGSGDVTRSHVEWRGKEGVTYVPSPLLHGGRLFVVNDQGIASCFAADSGQLIWKERLGGDFSASPVLAGDNIYIPNERGTTFVFKAADKYQAVAENQLNSSQFATLAITDDGIYLRTGEELLCIGTTAVAERAPD